MEGYAGYNGWDAFPAALLGLSTIGEPGYADLGYYGDYWGSYPSAVLGYSDDWCNHALAPYRTLDVPHDVMSPARGRAPPTAPAADAAGAEAKGSGN